MTIRVRADDASVRPRFSADEMRSFLPARGAFTFPEPYGTQGVRLTNADDGAIEPIGYSYWSNINNHDGQPELLAFVGRGAAPALLFTVNKNTLEVSQRELPFNGTGEGWYFSARQPFVLYRNEGPQLQRVDLQAQTIGPVFDLNDLGFGGHFVWQLHSSADDRIHSATLRKNDTYEMIGAVVYDESTYSLEFFPKQGDFDECQIDKSGRWLVIKEGNDNRIVDLKTARQFLLANADGALGHSDVGFGYMVGEDDMAAQPGALRLWRFAEGHVDDGSLMYHMLGWDAMARHVAHGNARDLGPEGQSIIVSAAHRNDLPRANEIVRVPLDGSLECDVIAPTLVDLDAPGGGDDYRKLPKANIDPTGEWVIWSSNAGTDRLDVYLVRVPG